jgi:hypothetical protein
VERASTIRAEIEICGVWVSRASASRAISFRLPVTSLMISAFWRSSTCSVPLGDTMPCSFGASSFASA